MYFIFYSLLGKTFAQRKSRLKLPSWRSIQADIQLSVLSAVIFALSAAVVMCGYDAGITFLYTNPDQYGLWYLGISFIAVLLLQDAYFYFIHRIVHHRSLFKWVHHGHHQSITPTPWTSFAFDLPEAIIQALFFVGIVFIVPLHFITLISALLTMSVWAVINHLGFELFPASSPGHWLGKWLIGPSHHAIHHRRYTMHYGLYFTFWDRLLGTQDPTYQTLTEYQEKATVTINPGLFVQPNQGTSYWFGQDLYTFKAVGADTGEAYALCEVLVAPEGGTPPHRHSRENESFYVQEGEIEFQLEDRTIVATTGTFLHSPRGQLHRFTNTSTMPVKLLVWVTPAGFEKFIAEVGKIANSQVGVAPPLDPEDLDKILTTAPKYGIEIIPPS